MTCPHCGAWQSHAENRYCAQCGATLPMPPVAAHDDPTLAATGLRFEPPPVVPPAVPPPVMPPPVAPPPAARRDYDWLRHPGTWAIAATALLVSGIVLAAVILSGPDDTTPAPAAASAQASPSAIAATASPAAPNPSTSTQTVVVVPAAPGSPAETRTVTVGPAPTQGAGSSNPTFGDATSVSSSYYQRGDTVYFNSPSGNIGCRLVAYGSQAQCTIKTYDFSEPGYDCNRGAGILMNSGGSPSIDCVQSTYRGEPTLEFGESVSFGDFSCVSRTDGITCLDSYGSGFLVGRKAYVEY